MKLKCNWLKEDGNWAYTIEDQGENGRIVGLDELTTDDVYCKPYFTNANELYFKSHEQAHKEFEKTHSITNEELAHKTEEAWTESDEYQKAIDEMKAHSLSATAFTIKGLWGFKYGTTVLIAPVFTQKPIEINDGNYQVYQDGKFGIVNKYAQKIIDWNIALDCDAVKYDQANKRIFFEKDRLWGVADNNGNILIQPEYKEVCNWSEKIYRVKKRQWGLIDINNALVLHCHFSSIGELTDGRALVKRAHPKDVLRTVSGYINGEGCPIISQEIRQVDANSAILELGLWGLKGLDGREIIPCQYDSIEYWSDSLYKVELNNKWGIIRIPQGDYLLKIEYDRIDNLKEGKATILKGSIIRSIDKDGNDVVQESIPLKGGLLKTKISGKWGIVDNNGNISIPHSYDEIGSFRSRLIGIINQHVIKLNADYDYPIHVCGKFLSSEIGWINVDIAGVKCRVNKINMMKYNVQSLFGSNNECRILAFMNINFGNKQYNLRVLPKNKLNITLSHGDKDSDFSIGETLVGTVKASKRNNRKISRLMVKFDDGRKTKVTRQLFIRSHQDITFYKIGSKIKLRKVGFNDEFDQTIWKIL
uniref:WG repeat-containing protein n=1 Tax=Prevotella sp. TaxID=59823 RepID=UPI0040250C72